MRADNGNERTWACDYCDKVEKQEGGRALAMPPVPPLGWHEVSVKKLIPAHHSGEQKVGDALDDQRKAVCPKCKYRLISILEK